MSTFRISDYYPVEPGSPYERYMKSKAPWRFFSGGTGSGKSLCTLWDVTISCLTQPRYAAYFVRQTYPQLLISLIPLLEEHIIPVLNKHTLIISYTKGSPFVVKFKNGSTMSFGSVDGNNYQKLWGGNLSEIIWDEAPEISFLLCLKLNTRMRKAGAFCRQSFTGNPQGAWAHHYKTLFIEHKPLDEMDAAGYNPDDFHFTHSTWKDNPGLRDTNYGDKFKTMNPAERAALEDGSWDTYLGIYFTNFSEREHVISRESTLRWLKPWYTRVIGLDWAHGHDSGVYWVARGPWIDVDGTEKDMVVIYREFLQSKLSESALGAEILARTGDDEKINSFIMSHDTWAHKTADYTVAEKVGDTVTQGRLKADKTRLKIPAPARETPDPVGRANLLFELLDSSTVRISEDCPELIKAIKTRVPEDKGADRGNKVKKIQDRGDDAYDGATIALKHMIAAHGKPLAVQRQEAMAPAQEKLDRARADGNTEAAMQAVNEMARRDLEFKKKKNTYMDKFRNRRRR